MPAGMHHWAFIYKGRTAPGKYRPPAYELLFGGFCQQFQTDWICLDAELMPWSAKAQELLRQQYAAVGAAAKASLTETVASLEYLASKNGDALPLIKKYKQRLEATKLHIDSYRRYCWPVRSVSDLKFAPFHLLATEGQVHVQRDPVWQMEKLAEVCKASDGLLLASLTDRLM